MCVDYGVLQYQAMILIVLASWYAPITVASRPSSVPVPVLKPLAYGLALGLSVSVLL